MCFLILVLLYSCGFQPAALLAVFLFPGNSLLNDGFHQYLVCYLLAGAAFDRSRCLLRQLALSGLFHGR